MHRVRLHSTCSLPTPDTAQLLRWLAQLGGSAAGVTPALGAHGLSLAAATSAAPGDALVVLPKSGQLSLDSQPLSPQLSALVEAVPAPLWAARLGLVLLQHRVDGPASSFAAYLHLLPPSLSVVHFWSQAALQELRAYPPLLAQHARRARFLAGFAAGPLAAAAAVPSPPFRDQPVDASLLGWAMGCASSRAFRLRGPDRPPSLLPVIDLVNHSFAPNVTVRPGPSGEAVLVAVQHLEPGQELLISYGELDNDTLLLDYGFGVEGNPFEQAPLSFSLPLLDLARELLAPATALPFGCAGGREAMEEDGVAVWAWQRDMLAELCLSGPAARRQLICTAAGMDARLLCALRVLYCRTREDAQAALLRDTAPAALERAVLGTAAALCAVSLGSFPQTLAEDEARLAAADLALDVRLAIGLRASKKRVLRAAMEGLKRRMAALG